MGQPSDFTDIGEHENRNAIASAHGTDEETESWQGEDLPGAHLVGSELSLHPGPQGGPFRGR